MARHKGDATDITNPQELDEYIRLIGTLDLAIDRNEDVMDERIRKIKAEHVEARQQLEAERAALMAQCQVYVVGARNEIMGDKKTLKLNFGKLGWRRLPGTFILPRKGSDEMRALVDRVESLMAAKPALFAQASITIERYMQKAGLKNCPDAAIDELGLERRPAYEEFFIEPDKAKLVEVPADAA